jgi:hypothetical protein
MPPAPIATEISYWAKRSPGVNDKGEKLKYSRKRQFSGYPGVARLLLTVILLVLG